VGAFDAERLLGQSVDQQLRLTILQSTLYGPIRENRTTPPRQDAVLTFLAACGVTDDNAIREWLFTWRRLKASEFEARRKQAKNNLIVLPKKAM